MAVPLSAHDSSNGSKPTVPTHLEVVVVVTLVSLLVDNLGLFDSTDFLGHIYRVVRDIVGNGKKVLARYGKHG